MKKLLLILLLLTTSFVGFANMTTSVGTGDWSNTTTWDTGILPPDVAGDTIYISTGDIVTLDVDITFTNPIIIIVKGELKLDKSLSLPDMSQIIIQTGGIVSSGNNGWRLDIGTQSWKSLSSNPITGPFVLEDNPPLALVVDPTVFVHLETEEHILFFPNPIHDKLFFNVDADDIISLYFYDETGRNVEFEIIPMVGNDGENMVEIDFTGDLTKQMIFTILTKEYDTIGRILVVK